MPNHVFFSMHKRAAVPARRQANCLQSYSAAAARARGLTQIMSRMTMRHSCPPSLAQAAQLTGLTRAHGSPSTLPAGAKSHATRNSPAAARSGSSCSPLRSGAAGTMGASSSFASHSGFASSAPHPRCARPRHRAGPAVGGASCPSPCNALSPALRSGCGPCRRCRAPMMHSRWATCLTSRVRAHPVVCRFADAPSVGRELPSGGPLLPRA